MAMVQTMNEQKQHWKLSAKLKLQPAESEVSEANGRRRGLSQPREKRDIQQLQAHDRTQG